MTSDLVNQLQEIESLSIEKKSNASIFKRRIDGLHEQNNELAKYLKDGSKEQDIAVEVTYNHPEPGLKTLVRMDTNAEWQEVMTERDNNLLNMIPEEMNDDQREEADFPGSENEEE